MSPEEHGRDFVALRNLVDNTFKHGERPVIQARLFTRCCPLTLSADPCET